MNQLEKDLNSLIKKIEELENCIKISKSKAESNIEPLNQELTQIKEDKRIYASKNDFESVQDCIRKEDNLKFKINAQWNRHSMLKDELFKLKNHKSELEYELQLKKDRIKRDEEILDKMNRVLDNYQKSQSLRQAAIDSGIDPNQVEQWFEWGKQNFNDNSTFFHDKIIEIDNQFKLLEAEKIKRQMDEVIDAYRKTNDLKESSRMAGVGFNTVQYWYDWGRMGIADENIYFYRSIEKINNVH